MAITHHIPKHFLCLMISHVIHDVIVMSSQPPGSGLNSSPTSFFLPPEMSGGCPCRFCSHQTYCQSMNHSTIPLSLPRSGVTTLHLYKNHLGELFGNEFRGMQQLRLLTLYKNNITRINKNAFAGLINLDSLHLEFNQITFILDGTFKRLIKLRLLYLNNNKLRLYPGDLVFMKTLTKLNVNNNEFKQIHWTSFIGLPNLRTLNLWKNELKCDCNTKQLITWLNATSKRKQIITGLIPDECVKNNSKLTTCLPIEIKEIFFTGGDDNVFIYNKTARIHCVIMKDLMPIWLTPNRKRVLPYSIGKLTSFLNGTLEIRNVAQADNGTYTCYAQYANSLQVKNMTTTLLVTNAAKPRVVEPYKNIQIMEGDEVTLNCLANGIPQPNVKWFAPNQPKQLDFSAVNRVIFNGTKLKINRVLLKDDGIWKCRAYNVKGSDVGRRRLMVNVGTNNMLLVSMATVAGVFLVLVAIVTVCICQKVKRHRRGKDMNIAQTQDKKLSLTQMSLEKNKKKPENNAKRQKPTPVDGWERVIESSTVSSQLRHISELKGFRL